jgi:membrane-associated phospholipid phosphatase
MDASLVEPETTVSALSPPVEAANALHLRRRNEKLLIVGVVAYALFVVVLMIVRGVEVTPDVMAVAFLLAAVVLGRGRLFLRDWVPFIALLLAYELMRGLAASFGFGIHVTDMVTLERAFSFGLLPTQVLQDWLHPAVGVDLIAIGATIVYMLHFALPLVTGFVLWVWRRTHYYDFVAALILLCLAAFVTFVVFPAAPPWYVAWKGLLNGADGRPLITYLKPGAFEQLANALGFNGRYIYTYAFYEVGANNTAAFPSLHAAFPFLSFLFLRRAFGRVGWLAFAYFLVVAFSIVYLGDHYFVDVLAGALYAAVAYWAVLQARHTIRGGLTRVRGWRTDVGAGDVAGVGAEGAVAVPRLAWRRMVVGAVIAVVGFAWAMSLQSAHETASVLYLVSWGVCLSGAVVTATGLA